MTRDSYSNTNQFLDAVFSALSTGTREQKLKMMDEMYVSFIQTYKTTTEFSSWLNIITHNYDEQLLPLLLKLCLEILFELSNSDAPIVELKDAFETERDGDSSDDDEEEEESENERSIHFLLRCIEILFKVSEHKFFCHKLFGLEEYYKLVFGLLGICRRFPVLGLQSTYLISHSMSSNHKIYGTKFQMAEKIMGSETTLSNLLAKRILHFSGYVFQMFDSSNKLISEDVGAWGEYSTQFRENTKLDSLYLLLKGSPYHCSNLGTDVLIQFLRVLRNARRVGSLILCAHICNYLGCLLKYGTEEQAAMILTKRKFLVYFTSELIASFLKNDAKGSLLRRITQFYSILLLESNREDVEEKEKEEEDGTEIIAGSNSPSYKLLESTYKTKRLQKKWKINPVEFNVAERRRNFDSELLSQELERSNLRSKHQENVISSLQTDTLKMKEEIESLKSEREVQLEHYKKLVEENAKSSRLIHSLKESIPQQQLIGSEPSKSEYKAIATPNLEVANRDFEEMLKVEDPLKVTESKAKEFIFQLKEEREKQTWMRKSICGSLKHLGAELYSSPLHFLHELVQNADDNSYSDSVIPILEFRITPTHLYIHNNERGFIPRDVRSLCSLGDSTKEGGVHIGQKGLGFKSVFSCTDFPSILSNAWSFEFRVLPHSDEMSYITPHWKQVERNANQRDGTLITLPLKKNLIDSDFSSQLGSHLDFSVLIALRNLKQIKIIQEKGEERKEISMKKTIKEENKSTNLSLPSDSSLELQEFKYRRILFESSEKEEKEEFVVYEATIRVPEDIRMREPSRNNSEFTRILLSFESNRSEDSQRTFPIFSFLPVQDIGLKFIINCDWILVTSRESIRENAWNTFLRNACAELFLCIFSNEKDLNRLFSFLPNQTPEMSLFWKSFVDQIQSGVEKKIIPFFFTNSSSSSIVLRNLSLEELVDINTCKTLFPHLKIIPSNESEEKLFSSKFFSKLFPKFSFHHIFGSVDGKESNAFFEFANQQSSKWWNRFFSILLDSLTDSTLLDKAMRSPIFLLNEKEKRTHLNLSNTFTVVKQSSSSIPSSWRKEVLVLLESNSAEETQFLATLGFPVIEPKDMVEIISSIHFENPNGPGSLDQVWKDLKFIRDNWDLFVEESGQSKRKVRKERLSSVFTLGEWQVCTL
eukprot:TRINITY_DN5485_c0_g1_i2.p1 TRINITY_DN5485_c0_g1~~TRINITY_DN5485_c0_g1_i2.p1  ORF type:complete len:1160 (+),score=445.11 TRINITY_DN5485_c0_g1_i2:744-4223(+)